MRPAVDVAPAVAASTKLPEGRVRAVLDLLANGATVPFIARYRKEATGSLDEVEIRSVAHHHQTAIELEERRTTIIATIEKQGQLTPELKQSLLGASSKTLLEDLYTPYKKRRKTRADRARELGLAPLAERISSQALDSHPEQEASSFVKDEVSDIDQAFQGAVDIVAERIADTPQLKAKLRRLYVMEAILHAKLARDVDAETSKFKDWDNFAQPAREIPSHRYLALDRGEREKQLRIKTEIDTEKALQIIRTEVRIQALSPFGKWLEKAVVEAFQRLLAPSLERELRTELKIRADERAVEIFSANLANLLLTAPLGAKAVLGVDPGLRTGAKCAMVSATGALVEHGTAFIVRGPKEQAQARTLIQRMVNAHHPEAIAVGNGTGSRETESFLRELSTDLQWDIPIVSVSEAGASVYSASDLARAELPDVDLTVRGAVSIARRLQDPLAELVKIDPAAIGVGQYQHDVRPTRLAEALSAVVEDCVHKVGVDLGTASPPLLSRVSGIGPQLAQAIVRYRIDHGGIGTRKELTMVKGLGKKAYELSAGFLRVQGKYPLDRSAVHPERYPLVEQMAKDLGLKLEELVGQPAQAQRINIEQYISNDVGLPTLQDICSELGRPGRDPRDSFEAPAFREDLHTIEDLSEGMELTGVVTNVTSFGAFVDIGVHQDGLVHISELSHQWVADPNEFVTIGQTLKVKILSVDIPRKRIGLSCKV
ncbi:MAG: RNA-binding transcriptional accessory protein [Myxococcales bacterium]|nr:RNA-binding transcriptional accessory protein [Myxococcales bacterium]